MPEAETSRVEPRRNIRGVNTRAKLLDAALHSFAVRGFHGTSTRDIADAAGMSPAGVYAHYRTKEELLFRLSLLGHTEVRDLVVAAVARTDDPAEQLRALAREFASWHARCHTHARVVQYEMAALAPEHAARIAELRRETQACVREVITRGVSAGVFDVASVGMVARAIVSLGIDVARWYDPWKSLSPDDVGEQHADLALRLVCGADS